jgi:APAF-1 helical domain
VNLVRRLGEWPLLLKLAAGMIRKRRGRRDSPEGALVFVERLLERRGVVAFDAKDAALREDAVSRTIAASRSQLDAADERRFLELAIFPEEAVVPLSTLERLWELDDLDTEECAQRFDDLALVSLDLGRRTLALHDVMTDYLTRQTPDAMELHARLVTNYGDPLRLPDPYAWRWLPYHLRRAGLIDQLRGLLLDPGWLQAQLDAAGPYAMVRTFDWGRWRRRSSTTSGRAAAVVAGACRRPLCVSNSQFSR